MRSFLNPLLVVAAMTLGTTLGSALPALAKVELTVTQGNVEPLPIAIPDLEKDPVAR